MSDSSDEEVNAGPTLDERAFEDQKRVRQAKIETIGETDDEVSDQADLLTDVPSNADELELTHSRVKTMKGLDLSRFAPTVKKICLRQNFLPSLVIEEEGQPTVAPLEELKLLEDLDFYDNKIKVIEGIKGLSNLKSLDFSFNLIKHIPEEIFNTLTSLSILYLIQNKISRIAHLDGLANTLTSLELGGNKIRTIENLDSLTNLTELWLGKNKITKLENLSKLKKLKILSIQSNRITQIEGLEGLPDLEEIYLSHNGLESLSGLDNLTKLRVLDLGANKISKLENVSHLSELEEFWANNNLLDSLPDVASQLSPLKKLETVYLEANPLQKSLGTAYRRKLMDTLPQVQQIDATFVRQM